MSTPSPGNVQQHEPSASLLKDTNPWMLTKYIPAHVGADDDCPGESDTSSPHVKGHAPSVILYTQDQISDLLRFCGGNAVEAIRSVLSVDRTFNVSTLFATVTVF